ncbi:unnamed protein product [Ambrosiozyma monospora]|uniref:Unnamed protein product n=1 Tax=Ambrosiozyma monospora TaxID=43982 RepID=A0A9W7DNP4_AMBMO|nr:unnamed protein product [Ambrosiozyma monospora]
MSLHDLKVSSESIFKNQPFDNIHVLNFTLNYYACIILLERLFVSSNSSRASSASKKCVHAAVEISKAIEIVVSQNQSTAFSHYFPFICYLAAMVHLVLFIETRSSSVTSGTRHFQNLKICLYALELNGKYWKRAEKSLNVIYQFAESNGVVLNTFENTRVKLEKEDSNDSVYNSFENTTKVKVEEEDPLPF